MFPSSLFIQSGGRSFVFNNPGPISYYRFRAYSPTNNRLYVLAYNNLIAHLMSFTEIHYNWELGGIRYQSPPLLSIEYGETLRALNVILPRPSRVIEDLWMEKGLIRFHNTMSGEDLIVHRDGSLDVDSISRKKTYYDDPDLLDKVYLSLTRYYQEIILNHNFDRADDLIQRLNEYEISNPYLKSALLYLAGDLAIRRGQWDRGEESLKQALKVYPANADAVQKVCILTFLRGHPLKALAQANRQLQHTYSFWGLLHDGNTLFGNFCYLHAGQFADVGYRSSSYPKHDSAAEIQSLIGGMLAFFTGNYKQSLHLYKEYEDTLPNFEVQEMRLLQGRAMILAQMDLAQARFWFDDLARHSLTHKHLAQLSRIYFLALNGERESIHRESVKALEKVTRISRGELAARLWLFYDAYIYGRIMELLGDRIEAKRGYQLCIEANPHTDLAKQAEEAIQHLDISHQ